MSARYAPRRPLWADYAQLMKPRLMSLSVFTAIVGMVLAPGTLTPALQIASIAAIALGAGASGVLNMWYDRDIDALMPRTQDRPLPAGRIAPRNALVFGVAAASTSIVALGLTANGTAAALLALTIAFYFFVYTVWLKRKTAQNIIIGGACGALPPLIGWACVTGGIALEPLLLFLLIFVWQAPHFWALSLLQCQGYAAANVPMLPVVQGVLATKKQIVLYTILMNVSVFLPCAVGMLSFVYGTAAVLLTAYFNACVWQVWTSTGGAAAKRLFLFSILYLFLLFFFMLIDHTLIGG